MLHNATPMCFYRCFFKIYIMVKVQRSMVSKENPGECQATKHKPSFTVTEHMELLCLGQGHLKEYMKFVESIFPGS